MIKGEIMNSKTYSAGIMAQAFWFNEMKQFLKLKKDQYSAEEIRKIVIEGILNHHIKVTEI